MSTDTASQADYFISYNHRDREWAEWIAWQLEEVGYQVLIQAWDFKAGDNFVLHMHHASRSARTIAVFSDAYLKAAFTQPEWAAAFRQDPMGEHGRLLPILVEKCNVEGLLGSIVYEDLTNLDEATAHRRLMEAVQRKRRKPANPPSYPGGIKPSKGPVFPGSVSYRAPRLLPRNRFFLGRDDVLRELEKTLTTCPSLPTVLWGGAGIGKSQVAREYVYRSGTKYADIFWLDGEDPVQLELSCVQELSRRVEVDPDTLEHRSGVDLGRDWLQRNSNWLLIIDNIESPTSLGRLLPSVLLGHVLITSRNPAWKGLANTIEIPVLHETDSIQFLETRTRLRDPEGARLIALEFGNLPLALEQAAAYLEETGLEYRRYVELCQSDSVELLKKGTLDQYQDSLSNSVVLSYNKITEKGSALSPFVLLWLSIHSPDNLDRSIIDRFIPMVGSAWNCFQKIKNHVPLVITDDLSLFQKYGLIQMYGEVIHIHRLVQRVILANSSWFLRKIVIMAALRNLAGHVDSSWTTGPPSALEKLSPHVLVIVGHAVKEGIQLELAARVLCYLARYFRATGQLEESEQVAEQARAIIASRRRTSLLTQSILTAESALASAHVGLHKKAVEHFETYFRTVTRMYARDHDTVIGTYFRLGESNLQLGNLDTAQKFFQEGIAKATNASTRKCLLGVLHAGLASVQLEQGQQIYYALESAEKAVQLAREQHPTLEGCHNLAMCLSVLALVRLAGGNLSDSVAQIEKSVAILSRLYGSRSPIVALQLYAFTARLLRTREIGLAHHYFSLAVSADVNRQGFTNPRDIFHILLHESLLRAVLNSDQIEEYLRAGAAILQINSYPQPSPVS